METLDAAEIDRRLASGGHVAIAHAGSRPIGYAWCAFVDVEIAEIGGRTLRVGPRDVAALDGYVTPGWRGRGVLPAMDRALMASAVRVGRTRQLLFTSPDNTASRRSMARMGKRSILRHYRLTIPSVSWWYEWSSDEESAATLLGPSSGAPPSKR